MDIRKRFTDYSNKYDISEELFFDRFEKKILSELDSEGAFKLIPDVVSYIIDIEDKYIGFKMLELLIALAKKTNSTEAPRGLLANFDRVERYFSDEDEYEKSKVEELRRWYRISK